MEHINIDALAIVADMEKIFTGPKMANARSALSCIIRSELSHSTAYAAAYTSEMLWGR